MKQKRYLKLSTTWAVGFVIVNTSLFIFHQYWLQAMAVLVGQCYVILTKQCQTECLECCIWCDV